MLLTKNDREKDGKYLLKVSDFGLSFSSKEDYIYQIQKIPVIFFQDFEYDSIYIDSLGSS